MIPHLETERLILRGYRPSDFDAFAAFMADPDVVRYLSGEPLSRGDAWRNYAIGLGHWQLRDYGPWAVERKSDRTFIGRVGLYFPEDWPGLECGWTLGRPYWGKGYATEDANAAITYAFLTLPIDRVVSLIDPDNVKSQSVALRLGEIRGSPHEIVFNGKRHCPDIWHIDRDVWQRRSRNA